MIALVLYGLSVTLVTGIMAALATNYLGRSKTKKTLWEVQQRANSAMRVYEGVPLRSAREDDLKRIMAWRDEDLKAFLERQDEAMGILRRDHELDPTGEGPDREPVTWQQTDDGFVEVHEVRAWGSLDPIRVDSFAVGEAKPLLTITAGTIAADKINTTQHTIF